MQNIPKSEGKQKQSILRFKINPRSPGSRSLTNGKLEVKEVNKMNAQYMEMKRQCDSYISWMESPSYLQQKETTKRSVILDASAIEKWRIIIIGSAHMDPVSSALQWVWALLTLLGAVSNRVI